MSMTEPETQAPSGQQLLAALAAATSALEASNAQNAELAAKVEALEAAQAEPPMGSPSFQPVHVLQLADGSIVEQAGAVPTHVDKGDAETPQRVPVTTAYRKE
jgi:hypothetical protein